MAKLALMPALVLVDTPQHGLKCGQIVEADAGLMKQLQAAGAVDPHKEAVAHAAAHGAKRVRIEPLPSASDEAQ